VTRRAALPLVGLARQEHSTGLQDDRIAGAVVNGSTCTSCSTNPVIL